MNKVIKDQLEKVNYADLTNYDEKTNTYIIPKKLEIKVEEDSCYLIYIKPSAAANSAVNTNWNQGNAPMYSHMKVDVSKRMGKMIKITGLQHDIGTGQDLPNFWNGWICLDDVEVLKKL